MRTRHQNTRSVLMTPLQESQRKRIFITTMARLAVFNGAFDNNISRPSMLMIMLKVFDLLYSGCNYQDLTECGERPVCDPCGANCVTKPPGPDIDCDHELDCSSKPDGYYADPFSCPKYWQCSGGRGQARH